MNINDQVNRVMSGENPLYNLNVLLGDATTDITFFGRRVFIIAGYKGSIKFDEVIRKIFEYFKHPHNLTDNERVAGTELNRALRGFFAITDMKLYHKDKCTVNSLTKFFSQFTFGEEIDCRIFVNMSQSVTISDDEWVDNKGVLRFEPINKTTEGPLCCISFEHILRTY